MTALASTPFQPSSISFRRPSTNKKTTSPSPFSVSARRRRVISPTITKAPSYDNDSDASSESSETTTCGAPKTPGTPFVKLPRVLPRPNIREVDLKRVAAVEPDLEGVPLDYVLFKLNEMRPSLLNGVKNVSPSSPHQSGALPQTMDLSYSSPSTSAPHPPSHILAVTSPNPQRLPNSKATLYPVHQLLLFSYCSNLPALPQLDALDQAHNRAYGYESNTFKVSVVPLAVPHPASFPLLITHLYTLQPSALLSSLLPLPSPPLPKNPLSPTDAVPDMQRLLASSFSLTELMEKAKTVHGLWSNVTCLGIREEGMWRCMALAWDVIVGAIKIRMEKSM